jgi:mannose-6-phosphate isomerase-like protein (cupin superfamily)
VRAFATSAIRQDRQRVVHHVPPAAGEYVVRECQRCSVELDGIAIQFVGEGNFESWTVEGADGTMRCMADGFVLGPGEGDSVSPAMTLKVGDVGAHLHRNAEELFYVLEGQLDLLAFKPRVRTPRNWQSWESHTGATVARGGPGSMMYVPRRCPHAFANPGTGPARMIFLVCPSGHEHYQRELAELVATTTGPLDEAIGELRARHDIEQLTPQLSPGRQ